MNFLSALGEFPEMLLGLASGFGFALLLGFLSLRLLVGLMTRHTGTALNGIANAEHNGVNDSGRLGSLLFLSAAAGESTAPGLGSDLGGSSKVTAGSDQSGSGAVGRPYLLSADTAHHRIARLAEPGAASV